MKKILLIRFSSIGDIVLTTPVIRCLHQQLGAEVHYLTKKAFEGILTSNPYITKVYTINKRVGELAGQLRSEGYDAVVDLHNNLRSLQVKTALFGVPARSFDKLNLEKWLMVNFKVNRLPDRHIVDRYLAAASPLGIVNDRQGLDYFIPPGEEVRVSSFLRERLPPDCLPEDGAYVAFAIGAAHATKRLPAEKITAICRRIPGPVVLLGGPSDREVGTVVAASAGAGTINTCGRLSLHQSASLVRQASCVITHDTGMMHIAAAFRKDILSVWGNTIPDFGMYPYYPEGIDRNRFFQVEGLPCRPCSKIGYQQCPKGHFRCMLDIPVEAISAAAEKYFQPFKRDSQRSSP